MRGLSGSGVSEMGEQIVLTNCRTYLRWMAVTLVLCVSVGPPVLAQSGSASKVLTLEEAVDFFLHNYPPAPPPPQRAPPPPALLSPPPHNYHPPTATVF